MGFGCRGVFIFCLFVLGVVCLGEEVLGVGLNYGIGWGLCFDVGFGFGVCLYFWFLCWGCFLKLRVFGVEWCLNYWEW